MKNKKSIFLIILIIALLIFPILCIKNVEKTNIENAKTTNVESSTTINDEEDISNYSKAYQEWLMLSDEEKEKCEVIPRKYDIPLDSIYEDTVVIKEEPSVLNLFGLLSQEKIVSVYADSIPETFDLRDEITIARKNQGSYGLCWAFAGMRSLETNLLLNGYGEFDFSELHVDYLTSQAFGGIRYLHGGGDFEILAEYAFNNNGPVLEETVPYSAIYNTNQYEYLDSLESKAHLLEIVDFPTIEKKYRDYTDEELELFRDKVKKHIMENGSVYIGINSDSIKKSSISEKYTLYNKRNGITHAISVIGWDDTFAKENFLDEDGNQPTKDGAYIAINSWGSTREIIYISYEDCNVEEEMSGVVSATTKVDNIPTITVTFKDETLYKYMISELGKKIISQDDENLIITCFNNGELELNFSKKAITDCSGLEKFNINKIIWSNSGLTDISCLSNLTNVKELNLWNNAITDISTLANFTKLTKLDVKFNKITDMSPLANLTNLTELSLSSNGIADLSTLPKLEKLQKLELSDNQITVSTKIAELTNLESLSLDENQITDVSVLSNLSNLRHLNLDDNLITNIEPISRLTNLNELWLNNNKIIDISSVGSITSLKDLSLNSNQISDITSISNLINLESLSLKNNKITEIGSGIKWGNLIYLNLEGNYIEEISGLSNCTSLKSLYLNDNLVSDVTQMENLTNLTSLYLPNNRITEISSVVNWVNLTILDLEDNRISDIRGLTNCTSLTNLYMNSNRIEDISLLTRFTNLTNLYLENNNIVNINPLSKLTTLKYLYLNNNQIEDISPLSSLIELKYLHLNNNYIDDISPLSNLSELRYLYLNDNLVEDISILSSLTNLSYASFYRNKIDKKIIIEESEVITVDVPQIIKSAQDTNSRIYSSSGFTLNNCTWNEDMTGICINTEENSEASVIIKSGKALNTQFNVTVIKVGITISELPKTTYFQGDELDLSAGRIIVTNEDGSTEEIAMNNENVIISGYDKEKIGKQMITVTYKGKTTTFDVTVQELILEKIEVKILPTKVSYYVGDTLDTTGLVLTGTNNNGSTFEITEGFTCTPTQLNTVGTQTITVTYQGKTTTFDVIVIEQFEIDPKEYQIKEIDGTSYIENIIPNTTIAELKNNLKTNGTIEIYYESEKIEDESTKLATGMELRITYNNEVRGTYEIVVTGDISGDGNANTIDLLMLARYKAGFKIETEKVKGAYLRATDIVKNDKLAEDIDLFRLARILVKLESF